MKKITLLLLGAIILLTACSKDKKSLTPENFVSIMQSRGLPADDITEYYEEDEPFEIVIFTTPEDAYYSIGFFKCPSVDQAKKDYERFKKAFIESEEGILYSTNGGSNYDSITHDGDDFYYYMSRINDTFICVNFMSNDQVQKAEVLDIIKSLGY